MNFINFLIDECQADVTSRDLYGLNTLQTLLSHVNHDIVFKRDVENITVEKTNKYLQNGWVKKQALPLPQSENRFAVTKFEGNKVLPHELHGPRIETEKAYF